MRTPADPRSFRSTTRDSPVNSVGPCPTSLGCTTSSYSSINPSPPAQAGAAALPRTVPCPAPLELLLDGLPQIPAHELRIPTNPIQGARHDIFRRPVEGPGEGLRPLRHLRWRRAPRCFHHSAGHPAEQQSIGPGEDLGGVTMQIRARGDHTVLAASVQRDVDVISKRSHHEPVSEGESGQTIAAAGMGHAAERAPRLHICRGSEAPYTRPKPRLRDGPRRAGGRCRSRQPASAQPSTAGAVRSRRRCASSPRPRLRAMTAKAIAAAAR